MQQFFRNLITITRIFFTRFGNFFADNFPRVFPRNPNVNQDAMPRVEIIDGMLIEQAPQMLVAPNQNEQAMLAPEDDVQPNNQPAMVAPQDDVQPNNQLAMVAPQDDIQPNNQLAMVAPQDDVQPNNQQAMVAPQDDVQPNNQQDIQMSNELKAKLKINVEKIDVTQYIRDYMTYGNKAPRKKTNQQPNHELLKSQQQIDFNKFVIHPSQSTEIQQEMSDGQDKVSQTNLIPKSKPIIVPKGHK